jgi:tetratricopeptide (TPR) repeat protein
MTEVSEPENGPEPEVAAGSISPSAAMAIGMRKGRAGDRPDPKFDAFLERQTRLLDLQTEHLHEQREVILARLQLGRWKDRVSLALQAGTALIGLVAIGAVGIMAWQAHEDHGVAIAAFSVPPDFAQKGLTGQVIASQVLDQLSDFQAKTVTGRPASTYANDWGGDIKVEIPETGVSVGELDRWLHRWLGHETRISGEVVRTPSGVAVTARVGDASGKRFEGAEADLDTLVGHAAEALYAQTQPYRYAVYLASTGREPEAEQGYARLAQSGSTEDRAWAYAGWAAILEQAPRRTPERLALAERMAETAIRLNPRLYPPYPIRGAVLHLLGRDEAALAAVRQEVAMHESGRFIGLPKSEAASRLVLMRGNLNFLWGDYLTAASLVSGARARFDFEGRSEAYNPSAVLIPSLALDHNVSASMRVQPGRAMDQTQLAVLEDWTSQVPAIERLQATSPARGRNPLGASMTAEVYAHLHRFAEAKAALAGQAAECDRCVLAQGVIAAQEHDWPAADRWFAQATRLAPSLPFAHTQWGAALMAKGDLDGAIDRFREAHRRNPGFADPLELWGEALVRKADYAGAIAKFAEADTHAPRWGRNHMMWGETLMLSGRYAEARRKYETADGMDLSKPDRAALNVLLARTATGPLRG